MIIKPCMSKRPEISIAPMMDWTDRHCRYFFRLISPNVRLYTEMVTTGALIHGDRDRFLRFNEEEHPIALQLGGSDAKDLAACAKMGEEYGYDEINLNCGCPSDRVQSGRFGACLMREPDHVADCVSAMADVTDVPVTVKCRIGIDTQDSFEFLDEFISKIAHKGCKKFIIHARKAWLQGLSPKENREIPELDYGRAQEIKKKYPKLSIILNGGITNIESVKENAKKFNGLMVGREAYYNPYFLAEIEQVIFKNKKLKSREEIAEEMRLYAKKQNGLHGTPVKSITRHILGLYHNQPGGKNWRRTLSTLPYEEAANENVIPAAVESINRSASEKNISDKTGSAGLK